MVERCCDAERTQLPLIMDKPLRLGVKRIEAGAPFQTLPVDLGEKRTDSPWPPPPGFKLGNPDLVQLHDDDDGDDRYVCDRTRGKNGEKASSQERGIYGRSSSAQDIVDFPYP